VAPVPAELERKARAILKERYPGVSGKLASTSMRQAKTPGSTTQYVFDFANQCQDGPTRVRIVLDADGRLQNITVTA
jgi:hypothetical protein